MGFFSETIKTFEVYNQPLFAYPDTKDMSDAILYGVLNNQDIVTHMKRAMITNLNMGHVRRFNKKLSDGSYVYGYPEVETNFVYKVTPELQAILDTEYGHPMTVTNMSIGSLHDHDWIYYQLGKNSVQNDFTYVTRTLSGCPGENEITYEYNGETYSSNIESAYFENGVAKVITTLFFPETGDTEIFIFDTNIQGKPTTNDEFITAWCSYCSADTDEGGEFHVWVYNTSENTYPQIGDIPTFHFGSTVGFAECFPAIPLRVKNVNYNDEASELNKKSIEDQLKIFGVDAELVISEVMSNAQVADDPNKMDNIFSNFGVRIWDESEAGRQYLYTFFSELHSYVLQAENVDEMVECIETKEDPVQEDDSYEAVTPETQCHSIFVKTEFSDTRFYFSGIKNEFFTKSQIDSDPDLASIYYSDVRNFDSSNNLTRPYHSSSGELLRPAGYTAKSVEEVQNWIDGKGTKSHIPIPEGTTGWNWLKPAVRIENYTGVVYDPDNNVLVIDELIPENIYEKHEDGIKIIAPVVNENVTTITYYAILSNGMDSFTVYGPAGQVVVEDTDTSTSRLVKLTLMDTNKLTVPLMFGLLENTYGNGQMHDKVNALVCSMHMSIYVADITVIKYPWWAIVLKIVMLVITVVMIYYGMAGTWLQFAEGALTAAILAGIAMYMISDMIFTLLSDISPWVALAASVVAVLYGYYNAGGLAAFNISTMSLSQMLQLAIQIISTSLRVAGIIEAENAEDSFQLLDDKFKEEMNEINKLLGPDHSSDVAFTALYGKGSSSNFVPIDPETYFNRVDNFCEIGTSMLDVDDMYNIYNTLPGVA